MNAIKTNLLSSDPSFFRGFGKVLDIGCTRDVYNSSENEDVADKNAINSDWNLVGEDIDYAYREFAEEISQELKALTY